MPGHRPRKVVIDGVPYAPLSTIAKIVAPDLRRALVEVWIGECSSDSEIDEYAATLRVIVTDSQYSQHDPTIDAFVASLQQRNSAGPDDNNSNPLS